MAFSPEELKKKVQDSLNNANVVIPAGHRGALVTYVDEDGVKVAIATKLGEHWQVQGNVGFTNGDKDKFDVGVSIVRTW